jgi:hypothetical protein
MNDDVRACPLPESRQWTRHDYQLADAVAVVVHGWLNDVLETGSPVTREPPVSTRELGCEVTALTIRHEYCRERVVSAVDRTVPCTG